jgi:catechol 2,3-dioxygenase-like lactoylglutathione lyase family enzyme
MDAVAVIEECKALSLAGKVPFPEVARRLSEVGVERYHIDLTRDESTYYLSGGESHVLATGGPKGEVAGPFDATAVEQAVRHRRRGHSAPRGRAADALRVFDRGRGRRAVGGEVAGGRGGGRERGDVAARAKSIYFRDPDGNLVELISPGFWETY